MYKEDTWSQYHDTYDPPRTELVGPSPGLTYHFRGLPCIMQLFGMFWTKDTLRKIVVETNWYANEVIAAAQLEAHSLPHDHANVDDVVPMDIDPELGVGRGPVEPRSRVREGMTRGGKGWYPLDVEELKGFLAIAIYMGIKKQPNVRSYWQKKNLSFGVPSSPTLWQETCTWQFQVAYTLWIHMIFVMIAFQSLMISWAKSGGFLI